MNHYGLTKRVGLFVLVALFTMIGCQRQENLVFEVNEERVAPPNVFKNKQKTEEQFISILHANLFQKAISANDLLDAVDVVASVGDKDLVHEVLISNFLNKPGTIIPSDAEMRADIGAFVEETYHRFLVRRPSEAERAWFIHYIESDRNVTPELVYFSFALSNEYLFY